RGRDSTSAYPKQRAARRPSTTARGRGSRRETGAKIACRVIRPRMPGLPLYARGMLFRLSHRLSRLFTARDRDARHGNPRRCSAVCQATEYWRLAMTTDNGGGAVLGMLLGTMLVLLMIFAFAGGFQMLRPANSPDFNITFQTPAQSPPPS